MLVPLSYDSPNVFDDGIPIDVRQIDVISPFCQNILDHFIHHLFQLPCLDLRRHVVRVVSVPRRNLPSICPTLYEPLFAQVDL